MDNNVTFVIQISLVILPQKHIGRNLPSLKDMFSSRTRTWGQKRPSDVLFWGFFTFFFHVLWPCVHHSLGVLFLVKGMGTRPHPAFYFRRAFCEAFLCTTVVKSDYLSYRSLPGTRTSGTPNFLEPQTSTKSGHSCLPFSGWSTGFSLDVFLFWCTTLFKLYFTVFTTLFRL